MPWWIIHTLHCACYDTSYTMSSLPGLWALQEVHRLLLCSSTGLSVLCVSGVNLETGDGNHCYSCNLDKIWYHGYTAVTNKCYANVKGNNKGNCVLESCIFLYQVIIMTSTIMASCLDGQKLQLWYANHSGLRNKSVMVRPLVFVIPDY